MKHKWELYQVFWAPKELALHTHCCGVRSPRSLFPSFPFQLTLLPSRFMHVWRNLQTLSVPLTTGYKSPSQQPPHFPRNVFTLPPLRGKKTDLDDKSPLLNADYSKSFSSTHASRNPFFHLWWFYISVAAIQQHRTLRLQSNLLWGIINTSLSH